MVETIHFLFKRIHLINTPLGKVLLTFGNITALAHNADPVQHLVHVLIAMIQVYQVLRISTIL